MRTTLTLDEDIAASVKAEVRRSGKTFKAVINELLRAALHLRRRQPPVPLFKVRSREMGIRPGLDYDRTAELVEHIEGPLQR